MAPTRWHNGGVERGLAVRLCSTNGDVIYVARNEDADALVEILNLREGALELLDEAEAALFDAVQMIEILKGNAGYQKTVLHKLQSRRADHG